MVELYMMEMKIDGGSYSVHLPATSWKHAEEMAEKIGGKIVGEQITQLSCIPAHQLMGFVDAVCDETPRWKHNALEHLEAFLAMGWPAKPEQNS